jgi:hypothetical protein
MIDFFKIADEYAAKLIALQNAIFKYNVDIDVFKLETIPAIQYCSGPYLRSMHKFNKKLINYIDTTSILNIGSGCNMLELAAKEENIKIFSADIKQTEAIFNPLRELLQTPLDYSAGLYGKEITVNTNKTFNHVLFSRYVPFEHDLDIELFESFMRSAQKYANKAIIIAVKGSYRELQEYLNKRGDIIIKSFGLDNTAVYEIDLGKI